MRKIFQGTCERTTNSIFFDMIADDEGQGVVSTSLKCPHYMDKDGAEDGYMCGLTKGFCLYAVAPFKKV